MKNRDLILLFLFNFIVSLNFMSICYIIRKVFENDIFLENTFLINYGLNAVGVMLGLGVFLNLGIYYYIAEKVYYL